MDIWQRYNFAEIMTRQELDAEFSKLFAIFKASRDIGDATNELMSDH